MLKETYHCDGPNCENTTPKESPSMSWKVVLWLSAHSAGMEYSPMQDTREKHFCSIQCEHEATAPAAT